MYPTLIKPWINSHRAVDHASAWFHPVLSPVKEHSQIRNAESIAERSELDLVIEKFSIFVDRLKSFYKLKLP